MSTTVERYETIITEYKTFKVSEFGTTLTDTLSTEISDMTKRQAQNINENTQKIDGYEQLHGDHKSLQKDNTKGHEARKRLFDDMNKVNNDYSKFALDAAQEHNGIRGQITSTEHPLRVLQNEVTNLHLDNKNLQQVIDTEAALRKAKAEAELEAVRRVNDDLKLQTDRLQKDINEETSKRADAQKILDELNGE